MPLSRSSGNTSPASVISIFAICYAAIHHLSACRVRFLLAFCEREEERRHRHTHSGGLPLAPARIMSESATWAAAQRWSATLRGGSSNTAPRPLPRKPPPPLDSGIRFDRRASSSSSSSAKLARTQSALGRPSLSRGHSVNMLHLANQTRSRLLRPAHEKTALKSFIARWHHLMTTGTLLRRKTPLPAGALINASALRERVACACLVAAVAHWRRVAAALAALSELVSLFLPYATRRRARQRFGDMREYARRQQLSLGPVRATFEHAGAPRVVRMGASARRVARARRRRPRVARRAPPRTDRAVRLAGAVAAWHRRLEVWRLARSATRLGDLAWRSTEGRRCFTRWRQAAAAANARSQAQAVVRAAVATRDTARAFRRLSPHAPLTEAARRAQRAVEMAEEAARSRQRAALRRLLREVAINDARHWAALHAVTRGASHARRSALRRWALRATRGDATSRLTRIFMQRHHTTGATGPRLVAPTAPAGGRRAAARRLVLLAGLDGATPAASASACGATLHASLLDARRPQAESAGAAARGAPRMTTPPCHSPERMRRASRVHAHRDACMCNRYSVERYVSCCTYGFIAEL